MFKGCACVCVHVFESASMGNCVYICVYTCACMCTCMHVACVLACVLKFVSVQCLCVHKCACVCVCVCVKSLSVNTPDQSPSISTLLA